MLTREEIDQRKERLRGHPETKKLCRQLGVTVERFLEDIEAQWADCQVYDAGGGDDLEERHAEVAAVAERAFREAKDELDTRANRKDGFSGEGLRALEERSRWLVGVEPI